MRLRILGGVGVVGDEFFTMRSYLRLRRALSNGLSVLGRGEYLQWPGRSGLGVPRCCSLINMRRRFNEGPGLILCIAMIKFPDTKCYR